jgi:hypothetical protein
MKVRFLWLTTALALCVFAFQSAGPVMADGSVPPRPVASTTKHTPLTRIAGCLENGSSCSKGSDCCSGTCNPMHSKCGR